MQFKSFLQGVLFIWTGQSTDRLGSCGDSRGGESEGKRLDALIARCQWRTNLALSVANCTVKNSPQTQLAGVVEGPTVDRIGAQQINTHHFHSKST